MASASDRQVPAVPAIPVSAGALIFDRAGRLLIVKPTYKSGWTIPGGIMEANGETPWQACRREVAGECGIECERAPVATEAVERLSEQHPCPAGAPRKFREQRLQG